MDSIPVIIRNKSMKYSIDGDIKEIVKVSFHNQNFQD